MRLAVRLAVRDRYAGEPVAELVQPFEIDGASRRRATLNFAPQRCPKCGRCQRTPWQLSADERQRGSIQSKAVTAGIHALERETDHGEAALRAATAVACVRPAHAQG